MSENILFYIFVLSQIILISYYYPGQILKRMKYVLKTYPSKEYPKLYPQNVSYYHTGQRIFRTINQIIFVLGLVILFVIGWWDSSNDGIISEIIPVAYFFIQIVPMLIMEFSEFAYFKMMRKADMSRTRKANLLPRKLFSFVSAKLVGIAILMFFACILYFNYLEPFRFSFKNDTFIIILTLVISNFLFAAIVYWNLYGKKLNPHQAAKDRLLQIETTIKSLVFTSIAASTFLILVKALNQVNFNYLEPVLMSVYLQFIIIIGLGTMLRNLDLKKLDFDVYKKDIQAT